jgi:pectinesterase inhibitor-like protein
VGRSPRRLARAALVVGADRARNCSAYIKSGGGKGPAGKDCAGLARDAEELLRQSAAEMERMGRAGTPRFEWSLSNVRTWASAALTDASTCLDSLAQAAGGGGGGKEDRDAVKRRVVAVEEATSNALALVNRLDPAPHRLL